MSLPKRLLEDGSSLDRALLRAGREDEPSDELRRKVLGAMAFGGAAASAPRPSLLSRLARPRFFAIAGAAVVGGAAIFATVSGGSAPVAKAPVVAPAPSDYGDQGTRDAPPASPAGSVTTPDALPSAPPLALGPAPASTVVVPPDPDNLALAPRIAPPSASAHHPGELPTRPALSPSTASPSNAAGTANPAPTAATDPTAGAIAAHEPAAASPLERETAALDAVKRQIDRGSAADALRALDAYEGEFPHGLLRPEAGALRVRALLAQGDRARATAVANELLARHPNSVHAKRIRALLADDERSRATNAVPAEK